MSKKDKYGGRRCGDVECASNLLFSINGANNDELEEQLDYQLPDKAAIKRCRREDVRRFKREESKKKGEMVCSIPVKGEPDPRYFSLKIIKESRPNDYDVICKRGLRALMRALKDLAIIKATETPHGMLFVDENELLEIVFEMTSVIIEEMQREKPA